MIKRAAFEALKIYLSYFWPRLARFRNRRGYARRSRGCPFLCGNIERCAIFDGWKVKRTIFL